MFVNCLEDQESNKHLWLLDNGYSNNMTCDMILFENLDALSSMISHLVMSNVVNVVCKGRVNFLTKQNEMKNVFDVYLVHGLKQNIMTVGKLTRHGYKVIFNVILLVQCLIEVLVEVLFLK